MENLVKQELDRNNTNILVIGNQKWYDQHTSFFKALHDKYNLLYINDNLSAMDRLWHNNYDMLLIELKFCKQYTIKLSQLSYARSKPSIILCDSIIMLYIYKLWKKFSKFTRTCCTMRKLMFIYYTANKNILKEIDRITKSDFSLRNDITLEIKKYFN